MESLQAITYWHWLILGSVLMLLELLSFTAILLWVGAAAFITALFAYLLPSSGWQTQTLCFAITTVVLLLLTRAVIQRRERAREPSTLNRRADSLIGQTHVLREPIETGRGQISIHDTIWQLRGPDLPTGASIEIKAVEDSVLVVAPIEL